jgi:hypothetical protein
MSDTLARIILTALHGDGDPLTKEKKRKEEKISLAIIYWFKRPSFCRDG